MSNYILDSDNEPYPVDPVTWAQRIGEHWEVAQDRVGDAKISTVFFGLDHNMTGIGPLVLWETMIFGGIFDEEQERYTSHEDALAGHARWVKKIKDQ